MPYHFRSTKTNKPNEKDNNAWVGIRNLHNHSRRCQIEIANYLKERTSAIDQLIKNIEAQIEKLQELRKIKIYEAVTGKIKVNAYAETTA